MRTVRPHLWTIAGSLLLFAASSLHAASPASSHKDRPEVPPTQLRSAAGLTEVGVVDGAPYRIDVPNDWNHGLVIYYHGYAQHPVTYHIDKPVQSLVAPLLDRHYAVAESAYSQTGWALQQAYPETEALRRYFIKRFGAPRETYVAGGSMGGLLTMITLEVNPKPYLGGLDLCGSVGSATAEFDHRFALRAAFDFYFPGLLPSPVSVPADFQANQAERDHIAVALRANPQTAVAMRNLTGLHTNAELAADMAYFTYAIGDLQRRAGGNPFDNTNVIYSGTGDLTNEGDYELNDRVRRYTAQPGARQYLLRHYTPTGHLGRPMLALHTVYDPVVPVAQIAPYGHLVQNAGFGANLVQQYVHREGHCKFTQDEVGAAFDELIGWTHGGVRPAPGILKGDQGPPPASVHEQTLRQHDSGRSPGR